MPENFQIVSLHALARDDDTHAANSQQGRRSQLRFAPADAGPFAYEMAVGETRHTECTVEWPHARQRRAAAEIDRNVCTFASRMRRCSGSGIGEYTDGGLLRMIAHQC